MEQITIEGVSFNASSYCRQISEGLTEAQFIDRGLAERKYKAFPKTSRVKLLKEAYVRIKKLGKKGTV